MSFPTQSEPVIIIGAGLAGLALGQSLKQAKPPIPFRIYERDDSSAFRSQGYRIRISPPGAAALQKLLPPHLYQAFDKTCAAVVPGLGSKLAVSGQAVQISMPPGGARAGPPPELMTGKLFNADRAVLRNVLLDGLEEHISFGKRFVRYESNTNGSVDVHFADGFKATGSIAIGADGTRSAVRDQLLPNLNVLDSEGRAVFGKTYLTADLKDRLPKEITGGMCMVVESDNKPIKMLCDLMQFDTGLTKDLKDRYGVPADYIYWVLCFRKDASPVNEAHLLYCTNQGARDLSLKVAEHWHESVQTLLEEQDKASPSTLSFTICDPADFTAQWQAKDSGAVTLLGDAAHPMTPVGGVGANTAFRDAFDLSESLARLYNGQQSLDIWDALREYQGLMIVRGEEMMKNSILGAGHFFGMRSIEELKANK